jgi:hypothetical protein
MSDHFSHFFRWTKAPLLTAAAFLLVFGLFTGIILLMGGKLEFPGDMAQAARVAAVMPNELQPSNKEPAQRIADPEGRDALPAKLTDEEREADRRQDQEFLQRNCKHQ